MLIPLPLDVAILFLVACFLVQNGCSRLRNTAVTSQYLEEMSPDVEGTLSGTFMFSCELTVAARKMYNSHVVLDELDKSLHKEYMCLAFR